MYVRPLKVLATGDLQEMSDTDIDLIRSRVASDYLGNPVAEINVATGLTNTSFGPVSDTRLVWGSYRLSVSSFFDVAGNLDFAPYIVSTTTVNWDRMNEVLPTVPTPAPTNFGMYFDSNGNIKPLTETDFLDTIIKPAITTKLGASSSYNLYNLTTQADTDTSAPPAGYSYVTNLPVFVDRIAALSQFAATNYVQTNSAQLDISTIVGYTYLLRRTPPVIDNAPVPLKYNIDPVSPSADGFQYLNANDYFTVALSYLRYHALNTAGYRVRYRYGSSAQVGGVSCGFIVDKRYATSVRRTYKANDNAYYTQMSPGGSVATASTTNLRQVLI